MGVILFFFQAEDGIRYLVRSRGLGDVYKRQALVTAAQRDRERAQADVAGTGKLQAQSRLVSPVDGGVSARLVEPATTVVAGQAVARVLSLIPL